jgi:hypothetical protein
METMSNDTLGGLVTALWNEYDKGLILWSEFNVLLLELLTRARLIG